jgi:hypothetical protein
MNPTEVTQPTRAVPGLLESESTVNVPTTGSTRPQRTSGVSQARRLSLPAVVLGVVVLAAACGSNGGSTGTGAAAAPSGGAAPTAAPTARPGTSGTISAVNPSSIFVQNTQSQSQATVNFTGTTMFSQTVTANAAALKVGDCVTATAASTNATPSASPSAGASRAPVTALTATSVDITSTTGNCTRTTGGGFGASGGPGGARPSGGFRPSGGARPSGAPRGGFGQAAFGKVASVGDGTFVVDSTRNNATSKVTVTTTSATTYREMEAATKANLKVGLCATAIGATDDTGAVTARTIALSPATSTGCTFGFGGGFGRGRFGGGAGGAGGGTAG